MQPHTVVVESFSRIKSEPECCCGPRQFELAQAQREAEQGRRLGMFGGEIEGGQVFWSLVFGRVGCMLSSTFVGSVEAQRIKVGRTTSLGGTKEVGKTVVVAVAVVVVVSDL
jgi:hypothetical protein